MLYIQLKPYENEFSTALSECKAVAQCATRKTDATINRIKTVAPTNRVQRIHHGVNRIKTVGARKLLIENTYIVNRIKTVGGLRNCGHHLENTYDNKLNDR